jgi:YD repeat-containing protein
LGQWTDENGTTVTNTWDNDGRLIERDINRAGGVLGPAWELYAYDGLARLTLARNGFATVQIGYDSLSRKVSETQGPDPIGQDGKTMTWAYGDDHVRTSATWFSGYQLDYTVDAVGRWTKIQDQSQNDLVAWSYHGPGRRIAGVDYLNGTAETRVWDGFRRVEEIVHETSGQTEFAGFAYGYDKVGNPLYEARSHEGGKGDLYAYDKANRLVAALIGSDDPVAEIQNGNWLDYPYETQIDYNMDPVSNRTSVVETPYQQQGTSVGYTPNALNQYTAIGGVSRSHDANGNLFDDGTYTFRFDYRNNLVKVEDGQVVVMEAEFDALGRRTKKTTDDGSTVTKYFYDGEHAIEEYDHADNLLRKFVYGQRIDEIRVMIAPDYADVNDNNNTSEILHSCLSG